MKVLMLAGYFPPHAPLAATRAPSFARWLLDAGHEVRVLAARCAEWPATARHGLPEEVVTFTAIDQGRLSWRRPLTDAAVIWAATEGRGLGGRLWALASALLPYPDKRVGWLPHVLAAGDRLVAEWRPDVIFATCPPVTTLLAASLLARRHGIPWVAEYRDLWVDHPYYEASPPRRLVDRLFERAMLAGVAGVITVTEGWVKLLSRRLAVPVRLALNGFDPADFPETSGEPAPGRPLTLLYAGTLYGDKRDPSPLLAALARLGVGPERIRMMFHVDETEAIRRRAEAMGVGHLVQAGGLIPRDEVLAKLQQADILVLLRWPDPREDTVIPGKFFEYVGAGRPILAVGRPSGEVADFIRQDGLGLASDDPAAIADWLGKALAVRQGGGAVAPLAAPVRAGYERGSQFARVAALLQEVAKP
jgi:hypothetical protein